MNVILALDGRWILVGQNRVDVVKEFAVVAESCVLVWLPALSTGEMTLQGDKGHAGVLIERREAATGRIDPESQVFIHHVHSVGSAYQAAYSIASLSPWQGVLGWAEKQSNHCLLTSAAALAWDVVRAGCPVVVHDGTVFTFWAFVRDRVIHASIVSMGTEQADYVYAGNALGQRVRSELVEQVGSDVHAFEGMRVQWLSVMRKHDESGHAAVLAAFAETALLAVDSLDKVYDTHSDLGLIASAFPELARRCSPQASLGPSRARLMLSLEKLLPVCALACILALLGFFSLSAYWMIEERRVSQGVQAMRAQVLEKQSTSTQLTKIVKESDFNAQMSFVASLSRLQDGHDVVGLLQAVKGSLGGGMRILGVRSVPRGNPKAISAKGGGAVEEVTSRAFIVDGVLPEASDGDSALLSAFVRSLDERGYTAEAIDVATSVAASNTSTRLFSYKVAFRERN